MSMTRITETFAALRARREVGLIPYITAGDPDLEATFEIVQELVRQGADIIELGVPFSDPMADGPTHQRAAERLSAFHGHGLGMLPRISAG